MPQTLSDIQAMLAEHGLHPSHRLGQNFLINGRKLGMIIGAAGVLPGQVVLEVGPGTGTLTEELLAAGAYVVAVEIDRKLEPILRQRLAQWTDRLVLVFDDVLAGKHAINPKVLRALLDVKSPGAGGPPYPTGGSRGLDGGGGFKLIANLPYGTASPLIANLVSDHPAMTSAVVMVQREVADRLTAPPGGKDYGPLGVLVQAMCQVKRIATLSPGCFWPQPKVDSAVILLERRKTPLTDRPSDLSAMLHRLFSKRRKQLGAILGRGTKLPEGIDPTARPETLSVQDIVRLMEALAPHAGS